MLTAESLRETLSYDPDTGEFAQRRASHAGRWKAGRRVGGVDANGYCRISVGGRQYLAHRLAWLYMTGSWPAQHIDHIDGDRLNNRISNLREADDLLNVQNLRRARRCSMSGLLGAFPNKKRWMAQIRADGRHIHLGTFDTPELAHEAYLRAKRAMHPGCTL